MQIIALDSGWQLKHVLPDLALDEASASDQEWVPAQAPGTVHQDLIAAGRISDPFFGQNENQVQWVGEQDWLYRCSFDLPKTLLEQPFVDLCLDGLDTFASVYMNGKLLLQTDNMFVPHRLPVREYLRPGSNELSILFESAWRVGRERQELHGPMGCWNTDPSRVYVRKAQYHYGWDWGPTLITAGPWRPIYLQSYTARIEDIFCPAEVSTDLNQATLPVYIELAGRLDGAQVLVRLEDPQGQPVAESWLTAAPHIDHTFFLKEPELWWPNGHGKPALYTLKVIIIAARLTQDEHSQRIGLRRLRLVQEPLEDQPGKSFYFEVNNLPIFCGGANWIPADNFIPRITPEQYRSWLERAAQANMNMLRVWGGGIYENDIFYDLCDELGLLVWQDFMFGCAMYPAYPEFLDSVRKEAEANVRRLRHHPCLAIWSGNNEDYQIAQSIEAYDPDFMRDFPSSPFPARQIYERLLPEVCAALDPTRTYWPGSPYWEKDQENITGDSHVWGVWHGQVAPYQDYPKFPARFVSEFGMQAAPHRQLIESFTPPNELYPSSRTFEHHNKATDGPRRLSVYLSDNVYLPNDLDSYIYATQFIQAEADAYAVRGWRRRWSGPGRYTTSGALVWQLNDCWPVTSWAIVDYSQRPKPAFYTMRRELAPVAAGLTYGQNGVEAWVVNGKPQELSAAIEFSAWSLVGERLFYALQDVELPANQTIELHAPSVPAGSVVISRLVFGGAVLAQATLWPEPFKYLHLPDPHLLVKRMGKGWLELSVLRPAKGVWLDGGAQVVWSDNFLDLVPGEPRLIHGEGLGGSRLQVSWLQRGLIGRATVD
jgi:beta-mannosidase